METSQSEAKSEEINNVDNNNNSDQVTNNSKSEVKSNSIADEKETKKLQAMLGNPKETPAKFVLNERDQKASLTDHKPQTTIYFKNCHNCHYSIEEYSTKILVESCTGCTFTFNAKIVTNLLDIWKTHDSTFHINTPVGTLQVDNSKQLHLNYQKKDHLATIVWANCFDLHIRTLDDENGKLHIGFPQAKETYPNIVENIDQFIVRFIKGNLLNEQIVRLANGFPTTEREATEFDKRQEENLKILANEIGITMGRKGKGPKVQPNAPCTCGSGKKYKKCHGVEK